MHTIISYVATTEQVTVLKNLLFQVITEAVYELLETKGNLQRVKLPVNQLMCSFLNNYVCLKQDLVCYIVDIMGLHEQ